MMMLKKPLNCAHNFMSNGVSVARFNDLQKKLALALRENAQLKQIIRRDAAVREEFTEMKSKATHH